MTGVAGPASVCARFGEAELVRVVSAGPPLAVVELSLDLVGPMPVGESLRCALDVAEGGPDGLVVVGTLRAAGELVARVQLRCRAAASPTRVGRIAGLVERAAAAAVADPATTASVRLQVFSHGPAPLDPGLRTRVLHHGRTLAVVEATVYHGDRPWATAAVVRH